MAEVRKEALGSGVRAGRRLVDALCLMVFTCGSQASQSP